MSYYWETQWIRKKIPIEDGVEIETCVDLTSGLIICPLCADISKLCPSYDKPINVSPPENAAYFFNVIDLIKHMKAHKESSWKISITIEEEEESESELEEE